MLRLLATSVCTRGRPTALTHWPSTHRWTVARQYPRKPTRTDIIANARTVWKDRILPCAGTGAQAAQHKAYQADLSSSYKRENPKQALWSPSIHAGLALGKWEGKRIYCKHLLFQKQFCNLLSFAPTSVYQHTGWHCAAVIPWSAAMQETRVGRRQAPCSMSHLNSNELCDERPESVHSQPHTLCDNDIT